jgi:hypothetical protein
VIQAITTKQRRSEIGKERNRKHMHVDVRSQCPEKKDADQDIVKMR